MKDKILAFLKTNAKLNGVQESYLLGVAEHYAKTITEESQIAATFTDGVVDFLKLNANLIQSEGDKRATTAAQTALKNYQEKHGLDENGQPKEKKTKKPAKEDDDPDEPAWFKKYREDKDKELGELKTKLETQEKEKTSSALAAKVKAHDKVKSIPEWFLKKSNLVPESEDKIEQLAANLESEWNETRQTMAESGVHFSVPPESQGAFQSGKAEAKNIAERRNANTSDGVKGKKV